MQKDIKKIKKYFYLFIHLNFVSGFLYAFIHFLFTPRSIYLNRRLWAYECWIILSFYCLFVYLIILDEEVNLKKKLGQQIKNFQKILLVNLLLLIFPWGLFLILVPKELLRMFHLGSFYWRLLGFMSLLGAILYYFPYRFYKNKLTYYVLFFGFIDNFLAAMVVMVLFFMQKIPLIAFSSMPLLLYFSLFFYKQVKLYPSEK